MRGYYVCRSTQGNPGLPACGLAVVEPATNPGIPEGVFQHPNVLQMYFPATAVARLGTSRTALVELCEKCELSPSRLFSWHSWSDSTFTTGTTLLHTYYLEPVSPHPSMKSPAKIVSGVEVHSFNGVALCFSSAWIPANTPAGRACQVSRNDNKPSAARWRVCCRALQ